ncbi:hypothetical protein OH76DRAFT_1479426 [Lentinus brumalis]|uniref:Uncharacterized protein n=1 Tax=Lentinus brumalis TaxID=2498619 RepID=A0A371DM68_9APHY|nr:hypothetical protein OH76DRAFT_1479426 [Polyporus brumalis]
MSPQVFRTSPSRGLPARDADEPRPGNRDGSDEPDRAGSMDVVAGGSTPPPALVPVSTPWENGGGDRVERLEQYLVLATDGHEYFFRVSLWMERTSRGPRPSVFVELVTAVPAIDEHQRNILLFLSMDLQAGLLRELNRAVHTQVHEGAT